MLQDFSPDDQQRQTGRLQRELCLLTTVVALDVILSSCFVPDFLLGFDISSDKLTGHKSKAVMQSRRLCMILA